MDRRTFSKLLGAGMPDRSSSLTTVPMVLSGDRLDINAKIHAAGALAVEIQDAEGRPIPGMGS